MIDTIHNSCNLGEKAFNIAGGIPWVAALSGWLRIIIGKVQMAAGAALACIGLLAPLIDYKLRLKSRDWDWIADSGTKFFLHGLLNAARGTCESILGMMGVGSLGLLTIQMCSGNGFQPIFPNVKDPGKSLSENPFLYTND